MPLRKFWPIASALLLTSCAGIVEQLPSYRQAAAISQGELTIYDRARNLLTREPIPASYPFAVVVREGVYDGDEGVFAKFDGTIRFFSWDDLTTHPNGVRLFSDSFAKNGALDLRVSKDACAGRPAVVFRLRERDGSTADRYRVLGSWSATGLHLPEAHQDRLDERWPVPECEPREEPIAVVQFEPGCAELTPLRRLEVAAVSKVIKQIDAPAIRLIGFSDTTGGAETNKRLAQQRAQSVARALKETGISGDIAIEARGEDGGTMPTADGVSEPRNRAVAILIHAN
jgi:outer membrane protein OmpA-like peptidoglycan-associated protein